MGNANASIGQVMTLNEVNTKITAPKAFPEIATDLISKGADIRIGDE